MEHTKNQNKLLHQKELEKQTEKKTFNLSKEMFFAHGTFLPNLESLISIGINLHNKLGQFIIGFTGIQKITEENAWRSFDMSSVFGVPLEKNHSGRCHSFEPVAYPLYLLFDPVEILKTGVDIGIDNAGFISIGQNLSAHQLKKSCIGIVVEEGNFALMGERFTEEKIKEIGFDKNLFEKYKDKTIHDSVIIRWLSWKMKEWFQNYEFAVPIYDTHHQIISPKSVKSNQINNNSFQHRTKSLVETKNIMNNLIKEQQLLNEQMEIDAQQNFDQQGEQLINELKSSEIKKIETFYSEITRLYQQYGIEWKVNEDAGKLDTGLIRLILMLKNVQFREFIKKRTNDYYYNALTTNELLSETQVKQFYKQFSPYDEFTKVFEEIKNIYDQFLSTGRWLREKGVTSFDTLGKDERKNFENKIGEEITIKVKYKLQQEVKTKYRKEGFVLRSKIRICEELLEWYSSIS